jgi:hypothetical protein
MEEGVLLIGAAALGTLFYTRGNITTLVTMYAISDLLDVLVVRDEYEPFLGRGLSRSYRLEELDPV